MLIRKKYKKCHKMCQNSFFQIKKNFGHKFFFVNLYLAVVANERSKTHFMTKELFSQPRLSRMFIRYIINKILPCTRIYLCPRTLIFSLASSGKYQCPWAQINPSTGQYFLNTRQYYPSTGQYFLNTRQYFLNMRMIK